MKKTLFFLVFLSPMIALCQIQVGQTITDNNPENLSFKVSLSDDGHILATGSLSDGINSNNNINIYELDQDSWVQLGQTINVGANWDVYEYNFHLSGDGNVLALVLPIDYFVPTQGLIRVYQFTNNLWVQMGEDIYVDDTDGLLNTISLSQDGQKFTVGALQNPGYNDGRIYSFYFDGNNWQNLGNIIYGNSYEALGTRVSLSADGNTLAATTISSISGVLVYRLNNGNWQQIGDPLDEPTNNLSYPTDISLSADGNTIAIGNGSSQTAGTFSGAIRMYRFNGLDWEQMGQDIYGIPYDAFGYSISLSANGETVVAGAWGNNENENDSGQTRIYQYIDNNWQQIGIGINGDEELDRSGMDVAISGDGQYVAIASPSTIISDNLSYTKVYNISDILGADSIELSGFSIYPNPTDDFLNIELANNISLTKAEIYNSLGQLISNEISTKIDVSTLSKGTYYIKLSTKEGATITKTFLKN